VKNVIIKGRIVLKNGMPTGRCNSITAMLRGYGDQKTFVSLSTHLSSMAKKKKKNAGISIYNLKTGDTWTHNGDVKFFMAGAIRLPVLFSLLYDFNEGRAPYDKKVKIIRDDQYPDGGILGRVDTTASLTLRDLARFMGALEDDTALDKAIGIMGMGKVNKTLELVGKGDIKLNANMRDLYCMLAGEDMKGASLNPPRKAWDKYQSAVIAARTGGPDAKKLPSPDTVFTGINQAAPTSLLMLMKDVYEMKILDRENTELFKNILANNVHRRLTADLPYNTGSISIGGAAGKDTADIAVINTPGGPVIVTVLVSQFSGDTAFEADKVMSKIGRALYDFYAGEE